MTSRWFLSGRGRKPPGKPFLFQAAKKSSDWRRASGDVDVLRVVAEALGVPVGSDDCGPYPTYDLVYRHLGAEGVVNRGGRHALRGRTSGDEAEHLACL